MARTAEWYGKNGNKIMEWAKNGLKMRKPTIKQGTTLERSKPIKNGNQKNSLRHKRSKMSDKMHKWAFKPWQMHEQWTSFWRTREVEHAQDPGTTNLYLANTGVVGHGSEIREGMVSWWGEGKTYSGVLLKFFWGWCSTEMTYHPKEGRISWNH